MFAIFRKTADLASTVDVESSRVIAASQGGECRHGPILPDGRKALTVRAELAKVFPIRIRPVGLGQNRHLAAGVNPGPFAVETARQCAKVDHVASVPKEGGLAHAVGLG